MSTITQNITEPAAWPSAILQVRDSSAFQAENQINSLSSSSSGARLLSSPHLVPEPSAKNPYLLYSQGLKTEHSSRSLYGGGFNVDSCAEITQLTWRLNDLKSSEKNVKDNFESIQN